MVCLSRPYSFKFFKGCLPQILLGPFLNTLSHFILRVSKMRSHVLSLVFLPKNANSKLRPLDAEIIKNCIVFYRKLLLQHVLVLLLSESKASDCLVNGNTEMRQKRTLETVSLSVDLEIKFQNPMATTRKLIRYVVSQLKHVPTLLQINTRGWCSTIEQFIDTTSKIWKEDLRHEAILFAADNYSIDERGGRNCSFGIERPVPKIANIRAVIAVVGDLTVFIKPHSGKLGMIKELLQVNSGLEKLRLQNVHQTKITIFFVKQ